MKLLEKLQASTEFIKKRLGEAQVPNVAITLGSGLGLFCDSLTEKIEIPYEEIPHFQAPTVAGHSGKMVIGKSGETLVLALQGRIHAYEGHSLDDVVYATRLVKHLGVTSLILTNASGGMNIKYKEGDLVLITDHINFTGHNPLIGKNIDELGPRFPDMSTTWTPELQEVIKSTAQKMGYNLKTGVYFGVMGPSYETPSEIKMFKNLGADMVGMSTVAEAIAGRHCGLKLAGISCITNMAAGLHEGELDHNDIKEQANKIKDTFVELLTESIKNFK